MRDAKAKHHHHISPICYYFSSHLIRWPNIKIANARWHGYGLSCHKHLVNTIKYVGSHYQHFLQHRPKSRLRYGFGGKTERRKDDGNAKRPSNIIVHGMRRRGWNKEPGNSEVIHRPGRRLKHEENGGKSWWHM